MSHSLWATFWLVDPMAKWNLGSSGLPIYSSWNAVYIPLLYWFLFSASFSMQAGIAAFLGSNDCTDLLYRNQLFASPKIVDRLMGYVRVVNQATHRPALFLSSFGIYWFYSIGKPIVPMLYYGNDVIYPPSMFSFLAICSFTFCISITWSSYLTFQYQFIVWDEEGDSGLIILNRDKHYSIAVIS
jgi:hypothetical protein